MTRFSTAAADAPSAAESPYLKRRTAVGSARGRRDRAPEQTMVARSQAGLLAERVPELHDRRPGRTSPAGARAPTRAPSMGSPSGRIWQSSRPRLPGRREDRAGRHAGEEGLHLLLGLVGQPGIARLASIQDHEPTVLEVVDPALRQRDVARAVEARGDGAAAHEMVAAGGRAIGIGDLADRRSRPDACCPSILVVTGLRLGTRGGRRGRTGHPPVEQLKAAADAGMNAQTVIRARRPRRRRPRSARDTARRTTSGRRPGAGAFLAAGDEVVLDVGVVVVDVAAAGLMAADDAVAPRRRGGARWRSRAADRWDRRAVIGLAGRLVPGRARRDRLLTLDLPHMRSMGRLAPRRTARTGGDEGRVRWRVPSAPLSCGLRPRAGRCGPPAAAARGTGG